MKGTIQINSKGTKVFIPVSIEPFEMTMEYIDKYGFEVVYEFVETKEHDSVSANIDYYNNHCNVIKKLK